jgi:hypothetical protein
MKVWIVERGHYSSREIERVFSTEKAAKEYIAFISSLNPSYGRQVSLDGAYAVDADVARPPSVLFDVWANEQGDVTDVQLSDYGEDEMPMAFIVSRLHGPIWSGIVRARDVETARKIAGEQVARAKAEAAGMR